MAASPRASWPRPSHRDFGSFEDFTKKLHEAGATHFGSGWAWLVHDGSKLLVTSTHDADLPLAHSQQALLTIDVWEHAYYVDYQNQRPAYLTAFLDHLVDWELRRQEPVVLSRLAATHRQAGEDETTIPIPMHQTGAARRRESRRRSADAGEPAVGRSALANS